MEKADAPKIAEKVLKPPFALETCYIHISKHPQAHMVLTFIMNPVLFMQFAGTNLSE